MATLTSFRSHFAFLSFLKLRAIWMFKNCQRRFIFCDAFWYFHLDFNNSFKTVSFLTSGLPEGVHSNHPCLSIHPSLNISETTHSFFIFLHEVRKSVKARFFRKIWIQELNVKNTVIRPFAQNLFTNSFWFLHYGRMQ